MEKAREWRREIVCVVKAELQTRSRTESALTHARSHRHTLCLSLVFLYYLYHSVLLNVCVSVGVTLVESLRLASDLIQMRGK